MRNGESYDERFRSKGHGDGKGQVPTAIHEKVVAKQLTKATAWGYVLDDEKYEKGTLTLPSEIQLLVDRCQITQYKARSFARSDRAEAALLRRAVQAAGELRTLLANSKPALTEAEAQAKATAVVYSQPLTSSIPIAAGIDIDTSFIDDLFGF